MLEDTSKIFENFEKKEGFPALPDVVSDVLYALEQENTSLIDLAEIIKRDLGFATQVMKYANSGQYILSQPISSVDSAVRLIGMNTIKGLCLVLPVFEKYKNIPGIPELWNHSCASAICCKIVAQAIRFDEVDIAETAGLLHDIGKVVLAVTMGDLFHSLSQTADSLERQSDWRMETGLMGVNHCFIGGGFARKFRLPQTLIDTVMWHHEFEKSQHSQILVCLCFVGDQISGMIGFGHPDYIFVDPKIGAALEFLGIHNELFEHILLDCLNRVNQMVASQNED
ncbi:MAG: HDOD domain-containing protein [Leptospirillum sp.]